MKWVLALHSTFALVRTTSSPFKSWCSTTKANWYCLWPVSVCLVSSRARVQYFQFPILRKWRCIEVENSCEFENRKSQSSTKLSRAKDLVLHSTTGWTEMWTHHCLRLSYHLRGKIHSSKLSVKGLLVHRAMPGIWKTTFGKGFFLTTASHFNILILLRG